jgi:hypothetical protein
MSTVTWLNFTISFDSDAGGVSVSFTVQRKCKMVQLSLRRVRQHLTASYINMVFDLAILLLGVSPQKASSKIKRNIYNKNGTHSLNLALFLLTEI